MDSQPDSQTALQPASQRLAASFAASLEKLFSYPAVYPGYLAFRIKNGLRAGDPEGVFQTVSEVRTVGDCRYELTAHDFNGVKYRVTVEVAA